MSFIDATEIGPRLFQGGVPPTGPFVKALGFDVLVLAACEDQIPAHQFPGVKVIHVPLDDCPDVPVDEARAAARKVADLWKRGATILVTCHMGWNRSGLIAALAWRYITNRSGSEAVRAVRRARGDDALSNKWFRAFVETLGPRAT